MGQLGSMDKLMGMIPGFGKVKDKVPEGHLDQQQQKIKNWKHAIDSMTPEEQENPELLEKQTTRIQRVAKGAGITTSDVRTLIKQYKMLKELATSQASLASGDGQIDQKTLMKFAKKFGRKMKF